MDKNILCIMGVGVIYWCEIEHPEAFMTNMTALQQNLTNNFSDLHLRLEEPLAHHTSFHIGGPCEVFAAPATVEQLRRLLAWCGQQGIRPLVLGAGTNVLAPDEGLRGLVIATRDCLKGVEAVSATRIRALAGTSMANVAVFAQKMGLTGLEFAHGIPGSIGGGVYMNAGAYGGEMVQVVAKSEYLTLAGEAGELVGDAHDFSYRHSAYSGGDKIITAVELELRPGDPEEIRQTMQTLMAKRKKSQPLELPSAGSTFKRPQGAYAAALIDQCGLKGFTIGGAGVSEKHAGFVVNHGSATAADVKAVIREVARRVKEETGFTLEPEVICL